MMAQQVTSMVGFQTGREVHEVEEGKVVLVVVMVVIDSHQVMKVGITSDEVVGVVVVVVEVVAVVGQVVAQGPVAVADHGAVPIFVKLLASPSDDVQEQAVWALKNVAGDSPRCRDLVLGQGVLLLLLAQLNEHAKLSMLRNATWTLSNF